MYVSYIDIPLYWSLTVSGTPNQNNGVHSINVMLSIKTVIV